MSEPESTPTDAPQPDRTPAGESPGGESLGALDASPSLGGGEAAPSPAPLGTPMPISPEPSLAPKNAKPTTDAPAPSATPQAPHAQPQAAYGQQAQQPYAGYPYAYGGYPYQQAAARPAGQAPRTACATVILVGLLLILGGFCLVGSTFSSVANQATSSAGAPLTEVTIQGEGEDRIALIQLDGVIAATQAVGGGLFGGGIDLVGRLRSEFDKASADKKVKAVILRIDSPGGTVSASDQIWNLVQSFRRTSGKPVVIHMGGTCASGGYYIACAGDYLIAEPTTITGSIGVILSALNFHKLLKEHGVEDVTITSGPNKALLSSTSPMEDSHKKILQGMVDETHARFVEIVAEGRPIDADTARTLADGRIYTAKQAQKNRLIDAIGYREDAIEEARKRANLGNFRLVRYERKSSFADALAGRVAAPQINPALLDQFSGPRLLAIWRGK